jgi:acetyl-CoA synthetase (ADP-forming)
VPGSAPTLSEAASKALMRAHAVPVADDREVADAAAAVAAADELGYPVVVKLCGDAIAHKTERGLVRLRLTTADEVAAAAAELLAAAGPDDGAVSLLVAPMLSGHRELIAGLVRDPQFGMNVMVGIGGILAEAVGDVVFCPVPVSAVDAEDMIDGLGAQALLGPFRGEPPVDRHRLADVLTGLSDLAVARPDVVSADLNPLIVVDGRPVAVDALVELGA